MTQTDDPNVRTDPNTGEQIVLEPGDEGYVEPQPEPAPESQYPTTTEIESTRPDTPGPQVGVGPQGEGAITSTDLGEGEAPPQDLTWQREPNESDAEFLARTRNQVVESQSPTDIVPNTPQIRPMGPAVETLEEELEEGEEGVEGTSAEWSSASDLIERARAATTNEELDEIEAQAEGRVTVENAVAQRREELANNA